MGWEYNTLEPYQTMKIRLIISDDTKLEPTPTISVDRIIADPKELFPITVTPTKSNTLYTIASYSIDEYSGYRYIHGNFTSKEAGVPETINITFDRNQNYLIRGIYVYSEFSAVSEPVYITIVSPPQSYYIESGSMTLKFSTNSSNQYIYCIFNDAYEDRIYSYYYHLIFQLTVVILIMVKIRSDYIFQA